MPILAYSEYSYFDTKQTDYENSALQHWVNNAQMYVNTKGLQDTKFIGSWEALLAYAKSPYPVKDYIEILSGRNDETCPYVVSTIPPLLQTSWGQACGYNDYAPPCQYGYCGKMLTGCVATAMAQYLKFYRFPSNYNYSLMPNNIGAPETARLMRDLGNLVYMNYGCNGSGASSWSIVPAFTQLGYNAYSQAYTKQATISMIREQGKPVYLVGYHQTAPIGHAWIADGYKEVILCDFSNTIEFMHMNWGFSNNPPNGWFIDLGDYPVAASMIIANPQ